jgi:N-acetylmuramoyl-L-alanine amidase
MTDNERKAYIAVVAPLVQKYAPQFNIMVCSPIIAQFCLECGYGTSNKVKVILEDGTIEWRHNYAGLKWRNNRCAISNEYFEEWTAEQNADKTYTNIVSRFCKFKSLEDCVIGYFQWTNIAKYSNLKGVTVPRTYLENIKADGYATSLKYVDNLMRVIDDWNLTQYDTIKDVETMARPCVCIDAGHYAKYNRCPGIPEYYESEVMWRLHLMQKKYLEQLGIDVITTRPNQAVDLALHERGKKAENCNLFISDHSNAVGNGMNETIDYVALYHLTDDNTTTCDDISKEVSNKLAPVIAEIMGVEDGFKVLSRKADNDRNSDGIMNDNYYGVLHGARLVNVPGIIIEHSFHTNSNTVRWLLKDDNLDKLAKAEAECIASYLLKRVVEADKVVEKSEDTKENTSNLYRVQLGAFSVKDNAERLKNNVLANGIEAIVVKIDNLYKVQCGAFSVKANAEKRLEFVRAMGHKNAFITSQGGSVINSKPQKTVTEIAKEVIAGKWGNGADRKKKLEAAGYDYDEVQRKVNELL